MKESNIELIMGIAKGEPTGIRTIMSFFDFVRKDGRVIIEQRAGAKMICTDEFHNTFEVDSLDELPENFYKKGNVFHYEIIGRKDEN